MARLRRTESQARTRELLVATARELFLRDGYHATSIDKVADAAGFSKGAVYSNFRNKDELCLAVLDAVRTTEFAAITDAFRSGATLDERIAFFERWAEKRIGDVAWTQLEMEFAAHASRNPELRDALARRDRAILDAFTTLLGGDLEESALLPPNVLATALVSLGIGLGFQRIVDPELPVRVLTETYRALLGRSRR